MNDPLKRGFLNENLFIDILKSVRIIIKVIS
jgi:hypothetical protein